MIYKALYFFSALACAFCAMLTPVLREGSDSSPRIINFVTALLLFVILHHIVDKVALWIKKRQCRHQIRLSQKALFCILFLVFFLIGIGNLLVYYPGTGMYDTLAILKTSVTDMAKQHPWFYCLIVRGIVKVAFTLHGGYELALVICSLLQITVTSGVYAYVLVWLRNKNVRPLAWYLAVAFYMILPIWGLYMVTLLKDVPFSLLLTAWVPVLYDYWETKGKSLQSPKAYAAVVLLILLALLRNNGIYVTAFILLTMLFVNVIHWKRVLSLFLVLFLVILGSNAFEKHNNITHLFKETVGIPLQQIAAVVTYGGEISDEQLEFVDAVLDTEFIKENYNPYTADKLKWGGAPLDNGFLNSHKTEFLKVWFGIFRNNVGTYLKAHLQNTYGFWSLNNRHKSVYYTTLYVASYDEWLQENEIDIKNILPEAQQQRIEKLKINLYKVPGSGTLFWTFVFFMLVLVKHTDWKILSVASPVVGCWITLMISTPVAIQWRYLLCAPMALPIIIALLFRCKPSKS